MTKKAIIIGAILAGTAVILGAMNAHYLKQFFTPDTTESFDTGVRYQIYHALAIFVLPSLEHYLGTKKTARIMWLLAIGTILFSGSIYALCAFKSFGIIGITGLGILTPIGGLFLIAGWMYLLIAAILIKK